VLGDEYTIEMHSAGKFEGRSGQRIVEVGGNLLAKAVFRGTRSGEDEKIAERLFELAPGYALDKRAAAANYLRNLIGRPIELSEPEAVAELYQLRAA
jgi:hypothetical protein